MTDDHTGGGQQHKYGSYMGSSYVMYKVRSSAYMVNMIMVTIFGLETSIGKSRSLTYLQVVVPHAITVLQDAAPRTFTTLYNTINRQFFNASCFKSFIFHFRS